MSYRHLSLSERECIESWRKLGLTFSAIGKKLGRAHTTILREVERNHGKRGYRHKQAHQKAQTRHAVKPKAVKLTPPMKRDLRRQLRQEWSPEQIAGRREMEGQPSIHAATIYRFVKQDKTAGGSLHTHLRHAKKTYRKQYGTKGNRTGIPDRVGIEKRPAIVDRRTRVGDWEGDTIIGKGHRGAILTLDERRTRLRLAAPLQKKRADLVKDWSVALMSHLAEVVRTITFDNGKEFALHQSIAEAIGCRTYFAQPYHSWERGTNENANGLLRQYYPKSKRLDRVRPEHLFKKLDKLNSRPRKCLSWKTPYEAFEEATGKDAKELLRCALMS